MVIDGHAHSCGIFYRAENIIKVLDELGVNKVVLCPGFVNDEKDQILTNLAKWFPHTDLMFFMNRIIKLVYNLSKSKESLTERNEYVFHLSSQYPDRIIQFYWINPNDPSALNDLKDSYSRWQFKGIKVHQPSGYFSLHNPVLHQIAQFATQNKLPFFIHLYSKQDVNDFIQFAQQHYSTNFIIGHLIGLEIFEKYEIKLSYVYFDISPIPLISDRRIMKAIRVVGAERLLLGSDTPFGKDNLKKNIARVNRLNITAAKKELILGENTQQLLN